MVSPCRSTVAYLVMGPTRSSTPRKYTVAPGGGGGAASPYSSTVAARTAWSEGSALNASSAAISAPVAPPTRQDCSSTPVRRRPAASVPWMDVVVAARGEHPGEALRCRFVVGPCLGDGKAGVSARVRVQQGLEAAAGDEELGPAVDESAAIVTGVRSLGAPVGRDEARHPHLADAVGGDRGEGFFEHQAVLGHLVDVGGAEGSVEFGGV